MKTIINLLLGVAILGTLCMSCRRDGDAHEWTGRVLEFGSDKPIAGATVYLLEVRGEILGPGGSRVVDSLVSDGSGRFTFRYADNPQASHRIRARADQYYQSEVSAGSNRSRITKDVILSPHSWLKVEVKNVNPVDQNDAIRIEMNSCENQLFKGGEIDDYTICQTSGNREISFYYSVTKIGREWVRKQVKCTVGSKDTTSILIEY